MELRGLGTDFTGKKQDKGNLSAFSMYFVTRFPAPIVQQPHNLFTCPFAADVLPETFFIPPSHPLLDRSPADPWLFCLNFCTPKQWFCISWVAYTCPSFSAFELNHEFICAGHLTWLLNLLHSGINLPNASRRLSLVDLCNSKSCYLGGNSYHST